MKHLFQVVYISNGKRHYLEGAGTSPYFESKQEAKRLRNDINATAGKAVVKVSYGPDHRHYQK